MTLSPTFIALAAAAVWFLFFMVLHIGGLRAGLENARWLFKSYAVALLGTFFTVIAMTVGFHDALMTMLATMVALLASACLLALYIPALYTVLTSLSVETMMFLRRRGVTAEAELYDRFAGRRTMEQRLATLLGNGYIATDGSCFWLTPRGRVIARTFAYMKDFWKLGPSG